MTGSGRNRKFSKLTSVSAMEISVVESGFQKADIHCAAAKQQSTARSGHFQGTGSRRVFSQINTGVSNINMLRERLAGLDVRRKVGVD